MALFFDGDFAFSVDLQTLAQYGLVAGKEFTQTQLEQLMEDTQYQKAKERAFRLLGYKSYTRSLLGRRLRDEEFQPETVDDVLDRLEELGMVDDLDYACRCSRDLVNLKHYGLDRVRRELKSRGVEEADIDTALSQLADDPQEQLRQVIEKKYAKGLAEEKGRRRAVNGLMRLGYSYGQIRQALAEFPQSGELQDWDE